MIKTLKLILLAAAGTTVVGCSTHYELTSISRQRIVVDKSFDRQLDAATEAFIDPFRQKVDSMMGPVMGVAARDMDKARPESEISNLLSDILIWASKDYGEKPDFAVYNIGGIRAALTKGKVTYGDINDIAPFENKIAFVTLTGEKVMELFQQIAHNGGEGVSHGVELVINSKGKLLSARLNGQEIDPLRKYRAVTLDYIVQGNDGMPAFKDGTELKSPQGELDNSRFLIVNYFKQLNTQGKEVDAQIEGRIILNDK